MATATITPTNKTSAVITTPSQSNECNTDLGQNNIKPPAPSINPESDTTPITGAFDSHQQTSPPVDRIQPSSELTTSPTIDSTREKNPRQIKLDSLLEETVQTNFNKQNKWSSVQLTERDGQYFIDLVAEKTLKTPSLSSILHPIRSIKNIFAGPAQMTFQIAVPQGVDKTDFVLKKWKEIKEMLQLDSKTPNSNLLGNSRFANLLIQDSDLNLNSVSNIHFDKRINWQLVTFSDVIFNNCDFTGGGVINGKLNNCKFKNCLTENFTFDIVGENLYFTGGNFGFFTKFKGELKNCTFRPESCYSDFMDVNNWDGTKFDYSSVNELKMRCGSMWPGFGMRADKQATKNIELLHSALISSFFSVNPFDQAPFRFYKQNSVITGFNAMQKCANLETGNMEPVNKDPLAPKGTTHKLKLYPCGKGNSDCPTIILYGSARKDELAYTVLSNEDPPKELRSVKLQSRPRSLYSLVREVKDLENKFLES